MSKKYLIIADDFTGANDTGVQLKKNGITTEVLLFPADSFQENSIVLDTESRTISPEKAYEKVRKMTEITLAKTDFDLVYKKIDSTLRGNIAEELQAVIDVYKPRKIVFAPAFPKIGRQTIKGCHYLNRQPLMMTEIAQDPLNPIWTDSLAELVNSVTTDIKEHNVADIGESLNLNDSYLHIFNIETDKQLHQLAKSLKNLDEKILFVGSAGLAEGLFTNLAEPVLSVVGSISEVSLEQMEYAESQGIDVVALDINDLLIENAVFDYKDAVLKKMAQKQDVILTVNRKKSDYQGTIKLFESLGMTDRKEISNLIKNKLARITKLILKEIEISGLFLTGGDTAIEVIEHLNANGCKIIEEVSTGVVKSNLVGGQWEDLKIVTKAGAFGEAETIFNSIQNLKTRR